MPKWPGGIHACARMCLACRRVLSTHVRARRPRSCLVVRTRAQRRTRVLSVHTHAWQCSYSLGVHTRAWRHTHMLNGAHASSATCLVACMHVQHAHVCFARAHVCFARMCTCACTCACTPACVCSCACLCARIFVCACVHICVHACKCAHVGVGGHVCACRRARVPACMQACACERVRVYTRVHTPAARGQSCLRTPCPFQLPAPLGPSELGAGRSGERVLLQPGELRRSPGSLLMGENAILGKTWVSSCRVPGGTRSVTGARQRR